MSHSEYKYGPGKLTFEADSGDVLSGRLAGCRVDVGIEHETISSFYSEDPVLISPTFHTVEFTGTFALDGDFAFKVAKKGTEVERNIVIKENLYPVDTGLLERLGVPSDATVKIEYTNGETILSWKGTLHD